MCFFEFLCGPANGLHPHLLTLGGARVLSVIRSEPLRKCSDVFLTYQVSR